MREADFALIGHQESWRAAADLLAVLRGPEHQPLLEEGHSAPDCLSRRCRIDHRGTRSGPLQGGTRSSQQATP